MDLFVTGHIRGSPAAQWCCQTRGHAAVERPDVACDRRAGVRLIW